MKSDVEIAREHVALPLEDIAKRAGLLPKELCYYGKNKAKVDQEAIERVQQNEPGEAGAGNSDHTDPCRGRQNNGFHRFGGWAESKRR